MLARLAGWRFPWSLVHSIPSLDLINLSKHIIYCAVQRAHPTSASRCCISCNRSKSMVANTTHPAPNITGLTEEQADRRASPFFQTAEKGLVQLQATATLSCYLQLWLYIQAAQRSKTRRSLNWQSYLYRCHSLPYNSITGWWSINQSLSLKNFSYKK